MFFCSVKAPSNFPKGGGFKGTALIYYLVIYDLLFIYCPLLNPSPKGELNECLVFQFPLLRGGLGRGFGPLLSELQKYRIYVGKLLSNLYLLLIKMEIIYITKKVRTI